LELRRLNPDIVACQEVFRSESGLLDTMSVLARQLSMCVAWSPARFKQRTCEGVPVAGWSGMAMLSRTPCSDFETVSLPADDRDGDRVAQICCLPWAGRRLILANVHLTHLRDEDGLRQAQIETVLQHPAFDQPQASRLICGDFNSSLDSGLIRGLFAAADGPSITDTYALGDGKGLRSTLPPRVDSAGPRPCIDFILSVANEPQAHPLFASSAVVLQAPEPASGLLPSDHYGVATTLLPLSSWRWRNEA
jgi:endonuclease/exonuclease/phosphatase family metal-dependent hydrolase